MVGTIFNAAFAILVLYCVCMDVRWKQLPLAAMLIGTGATLLYQLAVRGIPGTALLPALLLPAVFFGAQWFLSKGRWIGDGDFYFSLLLAAGLGSWQRESVAIYLAYVIGGTVAVVLLAAKRVRKGARIPFAPFLAAGFFISRWYGEALISYFTT